MNLHPYSGRAGSLPLGHQRSPIHDFSKHNNCLDRVVILFHQKKSSTFKNHFSKIIKISWDLKLQRCVPLFRGYPQASKPGVKLKENLDEKVTFAHLWQMYAVVNQRQNACPGWTARPGGQPTVLSVRNIWNLDVGLKFSFFQYCVNQPNFWEDSILPIGQFGFNEEKND